MAKTQKIIVTLNEPYGNFNSGDRAGFPEKELAYMRDQGVDFTKVSGAVNTSREAESKSNPEVRDKLRDKARAQKAQKALDDGGYNPMRSALAGLVEESTQGMNKETVESKLKDIADGA